MNCPKCKNVVLRKKDFNKPYFCIKCGGMWLADTTSTELSQLSGYTPDTHLVSEYDAKTGLCPEGHGIMIRARVDSKDPFFLEKCAKCGGIWFDKGEWERVAESHIYDNLLQLWSTAWQKDQRQQQNETELHNLYRQQLGVDIYDKIQELAEIVNKLPNKAQALAFLNEQLKTQHH